MSPSYISLAAMRPMGDPYMSHMGPGMMPVQPGPPMQPVPSVVRYSVQCTCGQTSYFVPKDACQD